MGPLQPTFCEWGSWFDFGAHFLHMGAGMKVWAVQAQRSRMWASDRAGFDRISTTCLLLVQFL
jgi:hypothetical protein